MKNKYNKLFLPILTALFLLCGFSAIDTQAQTRDPLLQPFSSESIWNMPLHNNAVYVDAQVPAPTGWGVGRDDIHIISTPNEPMVDVYELGSNYWTNRCGNTSTVKFSAPIPSSYTYYNSSHNNIFSIFLNNTTVMETQPMQYCSSSNRWTTKWTSGFIDISGDGTDWGLHGGTHLVGLGGSIRVHEMVPGGEIKHALAMNLFLGEYGYASDSEADGKKGYRWPAHNADSYVDSQYNGSVPSFQAGSLIALLPTFNVNALRTEPARIIAKALQDYGAYVSDDTAWETIAFDTEDGLQEQW